MKPAALEHVNVTVSDPDGTAKLLCRLFDWRIRWSGPALGGGRSIHVGSDDAYIVVYAGREPQAEKPNTHRTISGLNHIGVVTDDLEAVAERVRAVGYAPGAVEDYEPGRRFYFDGPDGIEFEVVSYAPVAAPA
ncbi:MAG: VOC family protein [Pseudomonadota bacterium]